MACKYGSAGCHFVSVCPYAHDEHLNEECEYVEEACPRGGPDCGGAEGSEHGVYPRCDVEEHEDICTMWRCALLLRWLFRSRWR